MPWSAREEADGMPRKPKVCPFLVQTSQKGTVPNWLSQKGTDLVGAEHNLGQVPGTCPKKNASGLLFVGHAGLSGDVFRKRIRNDSR